MRMMATPIKVPQMPPMPPESEVPPITTAATEARVMLVPFWYAPDCKRPMTRMPLNAAKKPLMP